MNRSHRVGVASLALCAAIGLAALALAVPSLTSADSPRIVSRVYPWRSDRLTLEIPADVHFQPGPRWHLTVRAPERTLKYVIVEHGRISAKPHACFSLIPLCIGYGTHIDHSVHVELTGPALREIKIEGAAKIDLDGIHQDRLALKINGSAQVSGTGSVGELSVVIDGAGRIHLARMTETDANVRISGAGTVDIAPTKSVMVHIDGAGEVRLHSNPPQVIRHINGAGEVVRVAPR
ncbi:MAG: GIN domain-containing protein [Steroidobacteraceae bacterium]